MGILILAALLLAATKRKQVSAQSAVVGASENVPDAVTRLGAPNYAIVGVDQTPVSRTLPVSIQAGVDTGSAGVSGVLQIPIGDYAPRSSFRLTPFKPAAAQL